MRWLKKSLKIAGITLLSLILLAFIIPVVFKKQVQNLVKREINKQFDAKIDFTDVKLSLFRHFPKATITIKGLSIVGKDDYAKDTLLAARNVDLTANIFSVLKGKNIKVHGLYIQHPRIHLLVNKFGKANWDIAKASTDTSHATDTTVSAFKLSLKKYKISNGYLEYADKQSDTYTELKGLNHSGSGNLTADVFTLSTSTNALSARFVQDGIPYLYNAKADINAAIQIDNKTNTYRFKTNDIQLNALKLTAEGFVQMLNAETFKMDFIFSSPNNDFKNILSMVPALYTKDFAEMKVAGEASFSGFVKGVYSPQEIPSYDIKLLVKEGSFRYPDPPKPVKNINLHLHVLNADGKPDNSIIDITNGHLEFDNEPFDFNFTYKNPLTIQYIDAGAKGKVNLSQLSQFIKLPEGTQLKGLVWADAFVKGPLKAIEEQTGPFSAGGFFDIRNLFYSDINFQTPLQNGNIKATLTHTGGMADKTVINIAEGHIEMGKDPVDFSLQLSNPVTAVNFNGKAKGRFTLENLSQFISMPNGTSLSGMMNAEMGFGGSMSAFRKREYDKITMIGDAGFENVFFKSGVYPGGINISKTSLLFNPSNISLGNCTGKYLGTHFTATGTLNNLIGYMVDNQLLSGSLTVTADDLNLNEWMGITAVADSSSSTSSVTSAGAFIVPTQMNFTVKASVNKVTHNKVDYNNISGSLQMNDEKISLQNIRANALDGSILINGSYSTKINKEKPDISLSYDIKNMDVQKAFNAYNTIQFLAPVGKFLSGKLHSQLSMTGNMDGSMMPLLNSLTGKGNLLLLEGVLAKFAPLEKMAAVLDIEQLKSISVKDIKNNIEFANGKVLVKPFTVKVKDIEMEIAGFHGLDQSLDYGIKMKLPRSIMGPKGNSLVNDLIAKANAKGITVTPSETISLQLKVTGFISNPSVSVNLEKMAGDAIKEVEEQAKDFAKEKLDSATKKTRDSLDAIRKQAEEKAKEKLADAGIDTTNLNIKNAKDTLKERVKDTLKKKLKNVILKN
ncbi:MAG TPA: AsmA-like C-terminal region-containing protein [Chitinophagaceae bacterium]|nr:AsmA-like C-terminal region-containing protein [Chitinophagaceae bacterium]